jgi:hypothetical protein
MARKIAWFAPTPYERPSAKTNPTAPSLLLRKGARGCVPLRLLTNPVVIAAGFCFEDFAVLVF